jgi:geranylgeranyl diphosphate synthase type 3
VPAAELLNLHRGQGLELFWRDTLTCPTEEEYIDMTNNSMFNIFSSAPFQAPRSPKRMRPVYLLIVWPETGGLLRMGIKLMMAEATSNVDV